MNLQEALNKSYTNYLEYFHKDLDKWTKTYIDAQGWTRDGDREKICNKLKSLCKGDTISVYLSSAFNAYKRKTQDWGLGLDFQEILSNNHKIFSDNLVDTCDSIAAGFMSKIKEQVKAESYFKSLLQDAIKLFQSRMNAAIVDYKTSNPQAYNCALNPDYLAIAEKDLCDSITTDMNNFYLSLDAKGKSEQDALKASATSSLTSLRRSLVNTAYNSWIDKEEKWILDIRKVIWDYVDKISDALADKEDNPNVKEWNSRYPSIFGTEAAVSFWRLKVEAILSSLVSDILAGDISTTFSEGVDEIYNDLKSGSYFNSDKAIHKDKVATLRNIKAYALSSIKNVKVGIKSKIASHVANLNSYFVVEYRKEEVHRREIRVGVSMRKKKYCENIEEDIMEGSVIGRAKDWCEGAAIKAKETIKKVTEAIMSAIEMMIKLLTFVLELIQLILEAIAEPLEYLTVELPTSIREAIDKTIDTVMDKLLPKMPEAPVTTFAGVKQYCASGRKAMGGAMNVMNGYLLNFIKKQITTVVTKNITQAKRVFNNTQEKIQEIVKKVSTGLIEDEAAQMAEELDTELDLNNDDLKAEIADDVKLEEPDNPWMIEMTQLSRNLYDNTYEIEAYMDELEDILGFLEGTNSPEEAAGKLIGKYIGNMTAGALEEKDVSDLISAAQQIASGNMKDAVNGLLDKTPLGPKIKMLISLLMELLDLMMSGFFSNLGNAWGNMFNGLCDNYSNCCCDYIFGEGGPLRPKLELICENIEDPEKYDEEFVKEQINELYKDLDDIMSEPGFLDKAIPEEERYKDIDTFTEGVNSAVDTFKKDGEAAAKEKLLEYCKEIEEERRQQIYDVFEITDRDTDEFSMYDSVDTLINGLGKTQDEIPVNVGNGYELLLLLKDKYRNTVLPLISNSGGNVISFTLIPSSDIITNENSELLDNDTIKSLDSIISNTTTDTKYWSNLKEILSQATILNMRVVITLWDFRDKVIAKKFNNLDDDKLYTDAAWNDTYKEFFTRLSSITSQYDCDIVINLGYHSYTNPNDPDCNNYPMYPTCGFIRKLVMYTSNENKLFTTNLMGLTANEDENLYYYNPYCEWYSFDDEKEHNLTNCQVVVRDYVDSTTNDNGHIITYDDKGKCNGGYLRYYVLCAKYSLPIFSMNNLKEKITEDMNINDPNIMNNIFCKNSREAIRRIYGKEYFYNTGALEFDENGEVI